MTIFSIIIPCFNEEAHIERCLKSIHKQSIPRNEFEVIVVDNGSSDNSVDISCKFSDFIYVQPDLKVGGVRNFGAHKSKGSILVFIDADCTLDPNWLSRAKKSLLDSDIRNVFGGGIALPPAPTWVEKFWLLEGKYGNCLPKELIGCAIVIHKTFFQKAGGFNENLSSGEDSEFSSRLKSSGGRVIISREFNVIHWGNAKTLIHFLNRQVWHSESYALNFIKNFNDPVFLITIASGSCAISAFSLLLFFPMQSFILILLSIAPPTLLTIKRYKRAERVPKNISELAAAYCLDVLYVTGRFIGIVKSLRSRLFSSLLR